MIPPLALAPGTASSHWPFVTLAVCVVFIIVAITRLRLPAFLALVLAAFLAGILTPIFPPAAIDRLPASLRADARENAWVAAVELTSVEFGAAAGSIAISIGLASIIGLCLMQSGAADKVVRRFLAVAGEERAGIALLGSTYLLSIPIFFDTMIMLMAPLARALRLRTGRSYLLYLMAICCAGVVTHSLTVPHPGPLAMVDNLRVDSGLSLLWGLVAGIIPCLAGYAFVRWLDGRMEVPLRSLDGSSERDLAAITSRPESELPSFLWSVAPILLPILLIGLGSLAKAAANWPSVVAAFGGGEGYAMFSRILIALGNKNFALLIGAAIALWVLVRQRGIPWRDLGGMLESPIATAAVIILITAAGGAFGGMLRHAGVGDAIKAVAVQYSLDVVVLGWVTAFVIRVAQGSATVAMLTASSILWPLIDPAAGVTLAYNPMYVFLAIGFGAFACSWMNDSGFWVVSKLGGLTERETLRSFTVALTTMSVVGLIVVWIGSRLLPLL
ncbi:MAG: hypothetical protein FJ382_02080 [Verrucomicrobia bacterium]|nr:hypothetical protein [Verrucomicrobiota bacterium]